MDGGQVSGLKDKTGLKYSAGISSFLALVGKVFDFCFLSNHYHSRKME